MSEFNPAEEFGISIHHAGIHVKDMERTYQWYHDVFGFQRRTKDEEGEKPFAGGVFPKMEWFYLGDFAIEVYEVLDAEPYSIVDLEWSMGVKHISFKIEKWDEFLAYIHSRDDITIVVENRYNEAGGAVYLRDPDGILVEVNA